MAQTARESNNERNKRLKRRTQQELYEDVGRGDRSPFQLALATALAGAPSRRDWKKLAADKPHLWANAVQKLAEPAGYVPRSMSVSVTADAGSVTDELVKRFGRDGARQMLEAAGLPAELVSQIEPRATEEPENAVIEGELAPEDEQADEGG